MGQFSRFPLSGLVAFSLTVATAVAPADAADSWSASITDVMNLVYCVVGLGSCEGLQPGVDTVQQLSCGEGTEPSGAQCVVPGAVEEGGEAASPPATSGWTASISDVMNLVYCVVGLGDCEGLQPGLDTVVMVTCGAGTVLDVTSTSCVCGVAGGASCGTEPSGPFELGPGGFVPFGGVGVQSDTYQLRAGSTGWAGGQTQSGTYVLQPGVTP